MAIDFGLSCLVMVTRRVNEGMSVVSVSFVSMLVPLIIPQSGGEIAKASVLWSEAEVQVAGSVSWYMVLSLASVSLKPEAQGSHYKKGEGCG